MKTQTIINCVFAVAFVGYVVSQRNPTFDTITCNAWQVVDADGKARIRAATLTDGTAGVQWLDKDEKMRISTTTFPNGNAGVAWLDKDGKVRIYAVTNDQLQASVEWLDVGGNVRIAAATTADRSVELPTKDWNPPKKP